MDLCVRQLGQQDYLPTWQAMREFTQRRGLGTHDQIWLLEHTPVFTLGLNGKPDHVLKAGDIPVIQTDRGGQVTYHGPGQLLAYALLDLERSGLGVKALINSLEQSVIDLLDEWGIDARRRLGAPGVYVQGAKIAALGLRVRRGCVYHGLALNVDMDLGPFARINPCGDPDLRVTQLRELAADVDLPEVGNRLIGHLRRNLGYNVADLTPAPMDL